MAVNDAGVIVGYAGAMTGSARPVRWSAAGRLSEMLLPAGVVGATARALNSSGTAVGDGWDDQGHFWAIRWDTAGSPTLLNALPAYPLGLTTADGINDRGIIVGTEYGSDSSTMRAVSWNRAGDGTVLPVSPGQTLSVTGAVNDAGLVVGIEQTTDDQHAVRWHL